MSMPLAVVINSGKGSSSCVCRLVASSSHIVSSAGSVDDLGGLRMHSSWCWRAGSFAIRCSTRSRQIRVAASSGKAVRLLS